MKKSGDKLFITENIEYPLTLESKEIKFTPDYKASEPIFWYAFKDLSKNDNNGFVVRTN
jgi:hypothetical protein